jgi:hypothetical protein
VQWTIRHNKTGQLQGDTEYRQSDATAESCIESFGTPIDAGIHKAPGYILIRKQLLAGYTGVTALNWVPGAFTPRSYQQMLGHLKEWHVEGRRHLVLKINAIVRHCVMADVVGADTAIGSIAALASQAAAVAADPRPRNIATDRQLAAHPTEQDVMEVGGIWASEITARWSCTQRACAFHNKGCCYWTDSDSAPYHVPTIPAVLTSWAEAVRDKQLTAAEPSQQMYGLMMGAKYERSHATSRIGKGAGVIVNNYPPPLPAPAPVPTPLSSTSSTNSSPSKKKEADSSPMRMPSDLPELSTIKTLVAFFARCKSNKAWITGGARCHGRVSECRQSVGIVADGSDTELCTYG